jgi:tRNA_anti-like
MAALSSTRNYAVLAATLLLLASGGYAVHKHARAHAQISSTPAPVKTPELERVPATTLYDAYSDDGAVADQKYRGKRFTITSKVVKVVRPEDGAPEPATAKVLIGSDLEPIIASGISPGSAAGLREGAPIEIDCVVTGAVAEIPTLDCGPQGIVRPIATERTQNQQPESGARRTAQVP